MRSLTPNFRKNVFCAFGAKSPTSGKSRFCRCLYPTSEAGWTSRKKEPLGIRLKSTRPSHGRFCSSLHPPEARQHFPLAGLSEFINWHFPRPAENEEIGIEMVVLTCASGVQQWNWDPGPALALLPAVQEHATGRRKARLENGDLRYQQETSHPTTPETRAPCSAQHAQDAGTRDQCTGSAQGGVEGLV